jgi:hypothetical protein
VVLFNVVEGKSKGIVRIKVFEERLVFTLSWLGCNFIFENEQQYSELRILTLLS